MLPSPPPEEEEEELEEGTPKRTANGVKWVVSPPAPKTDGKPNPLLCPTGTMRSRELVEIPVNAFAVVSRNVRVTLIVVLTCGVK